MVNMLNQVNIMKWLSCITFFYTNLLIVTSIFAIKLRLIKNFYSFILFLGKHIVIFAGRDIQEGEEITYDYKFPIEDVKLKCYCGASKCQGSMN